MKKIFLALTVLTLTVFVLTGCSGNGNMNNAQNDAGNAMRSAEDFVENTGEAVKDTVEGTVESVTPGNTVPDNNAPKSKTAENTVDTSKFIGEAKAKEIALNKANLTADAVNFVKVELDRDDGVWQYEVEFKKGYTEYDADIKAEDGAILKWDVDYDD